MWSQLRYAYTNKPHIFLLNGKWRCGYKYFICVGDTPAAAYAMRMAYERVRNNE